MRRVVLGVLAGAATLAGAGQATALGPVSCGSAQNVLTLSSDTTSSHFKIDYGAPLDLIGAGLTIADYRDALDAAYKAQVTDGGWWAPPLLSGRSAYEVVVSGSPAGGGGAATSGDGAGPTAGGDNAASPWPDGDAQATCLQLATSYPSKQALQATVAREFNRMILFGVGAFTGPKPPDPVFAQGGPAVMEEETFPGAGSNLADLWPDFADSLGDYQGPPREQWLALRGMTERFGSSAALRDFWELSSKNSKDNLDALDAVLQARSTTLAAAFHAYAIAARYMHACPRDEPYCFARAEAYLAGAQHNARADDKALASPGESFDGTVEDDYALRWVALPAARSDITLANSDAGGLVQASAVCSGASALMVTALGAPLGPAQSSGLANYPPAGCTDPRLVITSASRTASDPASSTQRSFRVSTAVPSHLVAVTLAGSGAGTVASAPAGIDCGSHCGEPFVEGTAVTLTASAAAGSVFSGWGGPCSGTAATCQFTLAGPASVVATFIKTGATSGANGSPTGTSPPSQGVGTSLPAALAGDETAPRITISRLRRKGKRALTLRVTCPASEPNRCSGFVALSAKAARKRLHFTDQAFVGLRGGSSRTLSFTITRRSQRALRRVRRLRVRALARTRDDAFNYSTVSRSLALRLR